MKSFFQWVEDLNTLSQNTTTNFPNTPRNVTDQVGEPTMTVTPIPDHNELLVKARVPGSKESIYNSNILFKNVSFKPMPGSGQMSLGSYLITNPRTGVKYYIDKLSTSKHNVQLNCTCPDFRQTFSRQNATHGALLGEPEPGQGQQGRNPKNAPGMCKHLFRVMRALEDKGILTQGSTDGWA